jgi:peptidyl-dipeptidase Dcp
MKQTARDHVEVLLAPWSGPFGGTPPFDIASPTAIERAYEIAVDRKRAEVQAIAARPEPADFENTVAALENAGRELRRVDCLFRVFAKTMNVGEMREVERRLAPLAPALEDEIAHNQALFERIDTVHETRHARGLSVEQQRLTTVLRDRLLRRGAGLEPAARSRLAELNGRLAALYAAFSQNLLAVEEDRAVILNGEADLDGLGEGLRAALAAAAADRGLASGWAVANTRALVIPFLTQSARRELRERVWRMWVDRGANPGKHDNRPVIAEILRLRGEKASLLGFGNHAQLATVDRMAGTPEAAMSLVNCVLGAVVRPARERLSEMQALLTADDPGATLAPWDRRYYRERLHRARFDLDADQVRAHLPLESVLTGMFWVADRLFQIQFGGDVAVPVIHPDVRAIAVLRGGKPAGLLWLDLFARPGKAGGGWMDEYRPPEDRQRGIVPLVSINMNLAPPRPGEPTLLSWDDARVLFHEFGHALNALCCEVRYPLLGILELHPDILELPSTLNERWLATPELLQRFAVHHRTGAPMPEKLIDTLQAIRTFDPSEGSTAALDYLATAAVDLELHLAADGRKVDPVQIEREVLARLNIPPAVDPFHGATHFRHAFAGLLDDRYAAGYYCYLWAEVLAADIAEAFEAAPGGLFDGETAERYRAAILSTGNSVPAAQAFRDFRGRDPDPAALLRRLGLEDRVTSG